jgi:predicted  nucleic acid-binding Zn-ribbon protein
MSFGIDFDALDSDGNRYTDDVYVAYVDVVEQPIDIGALNLELSELSGKITSNSDNIRNLSEEYERVLNVSQAAADGLSTINGNLDIVQGNLNDEVARAKAAETDLYSKINMVSSEYHW